MKKVFLTLALFIAGLTLSSCENGNGCTREKTTEEKVEEAAEAVADDIEDAFEQAGDEIEDAFDEIERELQ